MQQFGIFHVLYILLPSMSSFKARHINVEMIKCLREVKKVNVIMYQIKRVLGQ